MLYQLYGSQESIKNFKLSRNSRSYRDITPLLLAHGVYEIDVSSDNGSISENRQRQLEEVNVRFLTGDTIFVYIEDEHTQMFVGRITSTFQQNSENPFYLLPSVKDKSKHPECDISGHAFYTCEINWVKTPLTAEDTSFVKSHITGFLAKTIRSFTMSFVTEEVTAAPAAGGGGVVMKTGQQSKKRTPTTWFQQKLLSYPIGDSRVLKCKTCPKVFFMEHAFASHVKQCSYKSWDETNSTDTVEHRKLWKRS